MLGGTDYVLGSSRIRSALQQRLEGAALCAVVRGNSVDRRRTCIQGDACMLATGVQDVEVDVEVWFSATMQESPFDRRGLYPPQRLDASVLWPHAATHVLD